MTTLTKQFSGIHREVFYTVHNLLRYNVNKRFEFGHLEIYIPEFLLEERLRDNYDIKPKYNTSKYDSFLEYVQDKYEEIYYEAKYSLEENCLMYNWAYEPIVYDEEIANLCELIPFEIRTEDEDIQLLSFGGCGMDFTYKLEAYQLLADGSYDEDSNFARTHGCIMYFIDNYGKDSKVVSKINDLLVNKNEG